MILQAFTFSLVSPSKRQFIFFTRWYPPVKQTTIK
nr:MAG TPA: hypothetical protein [Caudoviricetes sp.]